MDRHGPPQRGESPQHERTDDGSHAHIQSIPGRSPPAARILALQRTCGNAAVTHMIAREGFAPKELPRLHEAVGEDFVSDFSRRTSGEIHTLETTLQAKVGGGLASAEDLHQLDLATRELHTRRREFERRLERMKPELAVSLQRDDDRARVTVEGFLIERPTPLLYVLYAQVEIARKMQVGYAMPGAPTVEFSKWRETIHLLSANFALDVLEFPEAGLVSEGLGPLEYVSIGRLAASLGKLGLKQTGKRVGAAAGRRAAGEAAEMGVTAVSIRLMRHRNVALERAKAAGAHLDAKGFGNLVDDEFKALVRADIDAGRLPARLRLASRGQRGADVWDPQSRIGWDLTTATSRQVAGHDIRYLLGARGTGPKTMHDGTRLVDVLPLVYSRAW